MEKVVLQSRYEFARMEAPRHPAGRQLLELWQAGQAAGGFAVGRDVPSRATARLLSSLMVLEPMNGGENYRIRLAGTALRRRWNDREVTGLKLSDVFEPELFQSQLAFTNSVLESGAPLILDVKQGKPGGGHLRRETILLRVLAPDATANWILVGIFFKN